MGMFKAFSRSSKTPHQDHPSAYDIKVAARLGQITKSVCRREMDGSVDCSPYTPCFDSCPVITPHGEAKFEAEDEIRRETTPKTRTEIIEAIREAGNRNSRVEFMRIVAEHPLDFATAMEAFRDGMNESKC